MKNRPPLRLPDDYYAPPTNEAAERLLMIGPRPGESFEDMLNAALAAERRATVERITKRLQPLAQEASADTTSSRWRDGAQYAISEFHAILDEEATR